MFAHQEAEERAYQASIAKPRIELLQAEELELAKKLAAVRAEIELLKSRR